MKKFFTLACAAVMALSASAITPAKLQPKQVENFDALKLEMPTVEKLAPVKHARPARNLKAAAAPAKKVVAATQDYTPAAPAYAFAMSWDSYYGDASWTIEFYDAQDNMTGTLELIGPSTANTFAGTYTVNLNNYCYVEFVRATGDTLISLVDGETFTVSCVSHTNLNGENTEVYHVLGDLTCETELIHLDFDFTVDAAADYVWYTAWFKDASIVGGPQAPLAAYCQQLGMYCQYESYVWIDLKDYMLEPVVVTGDTVRFENPYNLLPEFKYFAEDGVNRLVFRGNKGVNIHNTNDTVGVFGAFFFTADSLEEGIFDLLDQEQEIAWYNHVTVWANGDTTDIDINIYEPSSIKIGKSTDGLISYIDIYMAARDGKVYTTSTSYYMPTVATDSMAFAFQYDRTQGWSMPGADVDTTYFESDGDYMFGAYGLVLDTLGYIQDAYWLQLDVILTDESAVGTYTINDVYMDYSELYEAWFGYGLKILDLNFEIIDTDMDGYGDWIEGEVYASDGLIHPFVMPFVHPLAPTPTAIENNEAEIKATKSLKDGQLVIEKNGLKYNVLGASLK